MPKNSQYGDKMTKKGKGDKSKDDTISNSSISSDISFDSIINYDSEFDTRANFDLLQKHFDQKLIQIKADIQGQVNVLQGEVKALHEVIKNKDDKIGELYKEIGTLKHSCDFLTEETTVLKGMINRNEVSVNSAIKKHSDLENKTSDLEDRSRRNNIVFYNIPEPADNIKEPEDCDEKITHILKERGFFEKDYNLEIDRAHRLGRKRQDGDSKPRPIIARFCFYKDKDHVIKNGKYLRGTKVGASEDFSKMTLEIHNQLRNHAKEAQQTMENDTAQKTGIVHYKTTYRRIILTYQNKQNTTSATFSKSFSLNYITSNKNWFIPSIRTTHNNVQMSSKSA